MAIGAAFLAAGLLVLALIALLIATVQPDNEMARLTAPLAPAREALTPVDWRYQEEIWQDRPQRQTPTDLHEAYGPRHATPPGEVTMEFARIMATEYPGVQLVSIGHPGRALLLGEAT